MERKQRKNHVSLKIFDTMKNRFLLRTLLMTMVLFVPFYVSGQKSWQDIKIDLTNGNLLTETEISNQSKHIRRFYRRGRCSDPGAGRRRGSKHRTDREIPQQRTRLG